jgi:gliding motility-associated-like protein
LKIFNRYGELVFVSADVSKKWDGTVNGALQDTGNYVYTCEYSLGTSKKIKKGSVVLLR